MADGNIKRVLVVAFASVPAADRQGVEIENLLKALAPRFQVDVLTVRAGEMGYVERYRHTRMLRVPVGSGAHQQQVEAFRRAVRRQVEGAEYDLIHFRSAYGGLPICQLKEYVECKLVFELSLSTSSESGRMEKSLLASLADDETFCLNQADLLITRSKVATNHLAGRGLGVPTIQVSPGVDIDAFDWEPSPARARPQIVYIGGIGPGRGLRLLLAAFREVRNQIDAKLVLVGGVQEVFASYLENALSTLKLEEHVDVLGPVSHEAVPRVLAAADLCVCPWAPDPERQPLAAPPLKLLEYLACRKATIAPDVPTIRELISSPGEGEEGESTPTPRVKLFQADDKAALSSAIAEMIEDRAQRKEIAEAGYRWIRRTFSASKARRRMLAAYQQILPDNTALWGHRGIAHGLTPGTVGDKPLPHSDPSARPVTQSGFTLTVTPTGGFHQSDASHPTEPWMLHTPDTVTGATRLPTEEIELEAEPEFVAAGSLLGSSMPDTNPELAAKETDLIRPVEE